VELRLGVLDGPGGGVALVLHHGQPLAGRVELGALAVEQALGRVGGLGQLVGLAQQGVALGQVGGQPAVAGGGLVAPVGGDGLLLTRRAQLLVELVADLGVLLDPPHRHVAGAGVEVVGAEHVDHVDATGGGAVAPAGRATEQPSEVLGQRIPLVTARRQHAQPRVQAPESSGGGVVTIVRVHGGGRQRPLGDPSPRSATALLTTIALRTDSRASRRPHARNVVFRCYVGPDPRVVTMCASRAVVVGSKRTVHTSCVASWW
jgi:hypothetical protein